LSCFEPFKTTFKKEKYDSMVINNYNEPTKVMHPSSLMDSTTSPKVKTTEGEGVVLCSLACNTFRVKGRVGALRWGLGMSQPHFEASVRMKLALPKVGTWSPPKLPRLQSSIAGVKTPHLEVFSMFWKGFEV
jgi:hypothetical protein